ncbi:hypothetical protein MRB53_026545 [Persea americana]|uniref:Uncharacterized protein n=1 Tax=Persea americana TaxID=3435 RepID=A0ACC2LJJ8_PERAE|nr:hypothetical protein MRB53_026545 [Persea americana]
MASITLVKPTLLLVLITTTVDSFEARSIRMKEKKTKMVFYMKDWESGKNVTAVPVAGRNVFANEKYNGSTIEIQWTDRFFLKQREVFVVSRIGYFRFAQGFAVLETVYLDLASLNAVIKFNVTIRHY